MAASVGLSAFLDDMGGSFGSVAAWLPRYCVGGQVSYRCLVWGRHHGPVNPDGVRRSLSGGLAVLPVLHGRIRAREHEDLTPIDTAYQVRRCSARSPNLDDLQRLVDAPTTRLCT